MRMIMTHTLATLCVLALGASQAHALVAVQECTSDDDCGDGWTCAIDCMETNDCDPDDANCVEPEPCVGWCEPADDGKWTAGGPDSECETDADCADGFACVESDAPTAIVVDDVEVAVPPCEDGDEKCDEASDPAPSDPNDPVPGEEGQGMPVEEPPTYKYCEPKSCDVDADCGGDFVCVIETWGCDEPLAVPMSDCPPEEECDDAFAPAEPDNSDPCEPETQGHCAPTWLAPCEASADCGPGFTCVEEEICWGWSSGSSGSGSSAGTPAVPDCDPDDPDCEPAGEGEDEDPGSDNMEGEPVDPEKERTSGEECELTGEFYCEPELIDCSSEACPDGLVCTEIHNPEAEPCWQDSDGGTNCPGGEPPNAKLQACLPENFEDWVGTKGHGGSGASLATNDEAASPEDPAATDGGTEEGSSSGGGSDSGCAGGSPDAPMSAFALALLALGLVTRRRS